MSKNISSLDGQLFTCEAWRPALGGVLNAEFKGLTLKSKIGEFEEGTKFPFALLMGDASALILIDDANKEHAFRLSVSVGEALDIDKFKADLEQAVQEEENCDCGHDHSHETKH